MVYHHIHPTWYYIMYRLPLIDIIYQFPDTNYHLYAEDLQIYIELPLHAIPTDNYYLLNYFNPLNNWFLQNNMSKTSIINCSRVNYIFRFNWFRHFHQLLYGSFRTYFSMYLLRKKVCFEL